MSGWCHKCGYQMCTCEDRSKLVTYVQLRDENKELQQRLAAAEALLREAGDHMPDTADGWAENWIKRAEASLEWKP